MTAVGAEAAIRFAEAACSDPAAAVARWKAVAGGKAVCCFPLYAPVEIVAAAGMLPVTAWGDEFPGASPGPLCPNLCSVSRRILSAILGGSWGNTFDAFAFPTACDTARNAAEVVTAPGTDRPVFSLVFPADSATPGALESLLDRFEALAEWAEGVAGRRVRDGALDKAIRRENGRRRLFRLLERRMAETPGLYTAAEYGTLARAGMILPASVHGEVLRAALGRSGASQPAGRMKVFLSGIMAPRPVVDCLDAAGAAVVGDDLALGHRHYAGDADESGDPLLSLARRHLLREPCPALHCAGRSRIEHLFARVAACGADRIVLLRMRRCEPEGGDVPEIAEEARRRRIPFLCLDVDLAMEGDANLRVRIEGFLERIENRRGRRR